MFSIEHITGAKCRFCHAEEKSVLELANAAEKVA
jgi:hypothetical protein